MKGEAAFMKVWVDEVEKWPDYIIYRDNDRSLPVDRDHLDQFLYEVELTEEEVNDWEHASAVIMAIENKICKQLGKG
jgi:hypothetical protein